MRRRAVIQALDGALSSEEIAKALSGIDIIGDIGIIKIPEAFSSRKKEIGIRVLERLPSLKAVYRQTTPVSVTERVRGIEWLAGEERTVTRYTEHGCTFNVDLAQVYFSPRLSFERMRVAKLPMPKEAVINMFAGVGTFSIVMAKHSPVEKVYSIDMNPAAYQLMLENIETNKQVNRVIPLMGDAKDFAESLKGIADRVIMPLPEIAIDYFKFAVKYLKRRGWIHVYLHVKARTRSQAAAEGMLRLSSMPDAGFRIMEIHSRVVRSVGSRYFQVVVDAFGERGDAL